MTGHPPTSGGQKPIGIVAGGGALVGELVEILVKRSQPLAVAAISGEADFEHEGTIIAPFRWGEIGRMIAFFKKQECERLLLLGRIDRRPDFRSIAGDPGTLKRLPKILAAMRGGDDSLLQRVIGLIEAEGFQIISMMDVAPELLLGAGHFGASGPFDELVDDTAKAKMVLNDLGKHDIGQALVILNGRVLAVEGAEGTDSMLRRIITLREEGRIPRRSKTGLLVKAAKPGQDIRVDLPTIGPDTVRLAAQAGLAGIICEAGAVLVANRAQTFTLAKEHGIILAGEYGFHDG